MTDAGTDDRSPLVTVIVLNYNGAHLLPPCLEALAAQDLPDGQMEVWVVDNDSKDESLELLERDFPWVRVIRNSRNDGFAGGNNIGMRAARTPFVALINNDARPNPDWIRRLLEPFEQDTSGRLAATTGKIVFLPRFLELQLSTPAFIPGGLDGRELGVRIQRVIVNDSDVTEQVLWDRVGYGPEGEGDGRFRWTRPQGPLFVPVSKDGSPVQGPVRLQLHMVAETAKPVELSWPSGSTTLKVTSQPEKFEVDLPHGLRFLDVLNNAGSIVFSDGYGADRAYQTVDLGQHDEPEEVFAFCGGAVCLRTQALREVGYFDDRFFMYYEDTDLSWRLRAAGWSILYAPSSVTRHIHSASSVEWSPLFTFHVDRNRLLMLTKNATTSLAAREVVRYPLTTLSLALRAVARARHTGRRPPVRPSLLRLRVTGSYLRLLPAMLLERRRLARRAVLGRGELQRWLVSR
jgi:GT2 family glycosyltransferase